MPNRPFGTVADVWTHLVLAETLWVERPVNYWDASGSPAARAVARGSSADAADRGVWYFHDHAARSPVLAASQYGGMLREMMAVDEPLCPGAPLIAMRLLGHHNHTHFHFRDVDAPDLSGVAHHARRLDLPPARVDTRETADGGADALAALADLPTGERVGGYVHLDAGVGGGAAGDALSASIAVLAALAAAGVQALLRWDVDARIAAADLGSRIAAAVESAGGGTGRLWGGVFSPGGAEAGAAAHGCFCANLTPRSVDRCRQLGSELAALYAPAARHGTGRGRAAFHEVTR